MQIEQKKKQKVINVVRSEDGWVGVTQHDRDVVFMMHRKNVIRFGQEAAAQDNAYYSNKRINFYGLES